jgi:hypothetical protein
MFELNWLLLVMLADGCAADSPFLLRSYPRESSVVRSPFAEGPCLDPLKTLTFLNNQDESSFNHSECVYKSDEFMLTCKLGLTVQSSSLDLDKHSSNPIKVLVLFVQEFPENKIRSRVLDLCFLSGLSESLDELAICGYRPPVMNSFKTSHLHILDVPALVAMVPKIRTLMISSNGSMSSTTHRACRVCPSRCLSVKA